jgi:hypothetical protein
MDAYTGLITLRTFYHTMFGGMFVDSRVRMQFVRIGRVGAFRQKCRRGPGGYECKVTN